MTETYDVIVVGGGIAGLAAGAVATQAGARALVLEAHALGGRARCVAKNGYTMNMGAHALYMGSTGLPVLRSLGIEPQGAKPPLDRYRALRDGDLHLLPTGPGSLVKTKLLGARSKAQFSKLLLGVPRLDHRAFAGMTAAEWIASHDLRPDAAGALAALVRIGTYAGDLDRLSADVAVHQLKVATKAGVLYLDGGWDQLTDALAARTEVRTNTAVERVEGTTVTTVDGHALTAKAVVLALGTPAATQAVAPDVDLAPTAGPVTAACLDAAVRRVPDPGYVLGIDVPVYGTTQSPPARMAPEGGAVVSIVRYGARSADQDRPELEAMLGRIGVGPGDVVHHRFLARMVVSGATPTPATGGMAGRPSVATNVPGLFLAGDWVGPDGMLVDASLASAADAATQAVRAAAESSATMVA